ncbi:restriction endonuclease subunit S [Citricoccus sp. I39-566]|uniref:restriction endonuclease subunit S n=1 Tax=Citricoccus sp. I39-566 TaxID=3073268 RepID=UPI00286C39EA|nr:restriction endonuclease subunit S [Citricoccus sp. I39-566]WMY80006.1 restriction endonuclease subunit S [Citricoccus sp. I39-566]
MKTDNYTTSGARVLRGMNIAPDGRIGGEFVYVSEEFADALGSARLRRGDIALPHRGAIGRAALVQADDLVMSTSLMRLRLDPDRAEPRFVAAFLSSPEGEREILQFASTVGTPGIGQPLASLRKVTLSIPPLNEQRRIAAILGAFDDLIETNRALSLRLAELQRADFLNRSNGTTATLGSIADVIMGQSPPGSTYNDRGDGTPFYQGVRDFGWRFPAQRVWTTAPTRLAQEGDVLIAVRAPVGEANVATETVALGRGVAAVRATGRQGTLLQALTADSSIWDVHQGTGTVFASINKRGMNDLRIPWVQDDDLETRLTAANLAIRGLHDEIADLTRARDELLPLLMSGKVRVDDVEVAA